MQTIKWRLAGLHAPRSMSRPRNGGIAMTDLTIMAENYANIRTGIVELLKAFGAA